jgi:hypothetical protein
MPLICYKTHRFGASALEQIDFANDIIARYAAQGLSLTLRQLYYRFVAADMIPNVERSYKNLGNLVNDARLAGLMDWEAIEDRGRNLIASSHWDDPGDIIQSAARSYRIDKWADQDYRVEVWVEKQALEAVVGMAASPLDVAYYACKGYCSQSEMWRAAQRFEAYVEQGQQPVIIHLGDHDPSGVDMTRDITDRLNELFGINVEVERIALNKDQIEEYEPPPNPAKMSDSRAGAYVAEHGNESWELDALEPDVLQRLITRTIIGYRDEAQWEAKVAEEAEAREHLKQASSRWSDVESFLAKPKKGKR